MDEGMDLFEAGAMDDGGGPMALDNEPAGAAAASDLIVQHSSLDLENYLSAYTGRTRLKRLQFIAKQCPSLRVEALRLALAEVEGGPQPELQVDIADELITACATAQSACDAAVLEDATVKEQLSKNARQRDQLEKNLKEYKTNMVKESIRMGHNELGDHMYTTGELNPAMKQYQRCRDYSTSSGHVLEMCENVIKVALEIPNWTHLLSYITKAESTKEVEKNPMLATKLKCCAGLANLALRSYNTAAQLLLQASFDNADIPGIMSQRDVATYGGLCALASFTRTELKEKVMENPGFKEFLELFPEVRELIKGFYASDYGNCLKLMDKVKSDLLLDVYLAEHIPYIYKRIREKMLIQYFSPFLSVDLSTMAEAFLSTVPELEAELTKLITGGMISARIDSDKKIMYARKTDQRASTFKKAIEVGRTYQIHMQAVLLRAAMIKAGVMVQNNREARHHAIPAEPVAMDE